MKQGLFKTYWQALEGFRKHALLVILLTGFSGMLEGTALLTLIPVLNTDSSSETVSEILFQIFQFLGFSPEDYQIAAIVSFLIIGLISTTIYLLSEISIIRLGTHLEKHFRLNLSHGLFKMQWSRFLSISLGDLNKATFTEVEYISDGIYYFLVGIGASLVCLCFIFLAFSISIEITLYALIFAIFAGTGYKFAGDKGFEHGQKLSETSTLIGEHVGEIYNNLKLLKATGYIPQAKKQAHKLFTQFAHDCFWSKSYGIYMQGIFDGLSFLFLTGVLAFSIISSNLPVEKIVVFLAIFYRLVPRTRLVHNYFYEARNHQPWYLSWKKRYDQISKYPEKKSGKTKLLFQNSLELEEVYFKYLNSPVDVLRGINLKIGKGQFIGLVGGSGSGKSTLIDLITGIFIPSNGRLSLDNIPFEDLDLEEWRSKIGLVLQDSPIFNTTILNNIAWGFSEPDLEQVRHKAKLAHAWEFIEALPEGLNTHLGDKGARLSGGQKQRIALARALYRDPDLLILDEATSALDSESEIEIQKALESLRGKISILMVAHRLNTIQKADEILVLEGGKIVEKGNWLSLTSKPNGIFQKMADMQSLVNKSN